MYINQNNTVTLIGRVSKMTRFENSDQSSTVLLTIAVPRDYKGDRTDFIQTKGFVPAGKKGPYEYMSIGDRIQITGMVASENYTDKAGEQVYTQSIRISQISFLDSQVDRQRHREAHQQAATNQKQTRSRRSA